MSGTDTGKRTATKRIESVWESARGDLAVERIGGQLYFVRRAPMEEAARKTFAEHPAWEGRLNLRQKQVLEGIGESLSNKEIANKLNVAERTVKFYVSELMNKMQCRNRFEIGWRFRLGNILEDRHAHNPGGRG